MVTGGASGIGRALAETLARSDCEVLGGDLQVELVDMPPEKARELWERGKPMPPGVFASKVLRLVARNRAVIVVPSWWKLLRWVNRLCPSVGIVLAQRSLQKCQAELGIS